MRWGALAALLASSVYAGEAEFGPNDVPTMFYFSKSDDKNRVDYGVRLDAACKPVGEEPVFGYWREFENYEGKRTATLAFFEQPAYGVSEQKVKGNEIKVTLRAVPREIVITTSKDESGKCKTVSKTDIAKTSAELKSAYIKLKRGWTVDYVEIRGNDAAGKGLSERLTP